MPPTPVIFDAGHLVLTPHTGPKFQLFSSTWILTNNGGDEGNFPLQNGPKTAGSHPIGAHFAGSLSLGWGFASKGATKYQKMWYSGSLTLKGSVTLSDSMPDSVVIVRPFTMSGLMQGYLSNPFIDIIDPPKFDIKFKGAGKAVIEMISIVDNGVRLFDLRRVSYNFM